MLLSSQDLGAALRAKRRAAGLTVVTRNVADFKPTGVAILNPWEDVN